jgi:hypothetical protein
MIRVTVLALLSITVFAGCVGTQPKVPLPSDRRSLEEIQLGFARGVAPFWYIHSTYFAANPDAPNAVIRVSITIAPDGSVTECVPVSIADAPDELVAKVVHRVKKLKFGARNVPPFRYESYPISFIRKEAQQGAQADVHVFGVDAA